VFRNVAASEGARDDISFDRLEELRVAVDEAATLVLLAEGARTITLDLRSDDGGLRVSVRSDGTAEDWPGDRHRSWGGKVIAALASDVRMTVDDGCPEVGFSWPAAERARVDRREG
jgi:hypothetical protein